MFPVLGLVQHSITVFYSGKGSWSGSFVNNLCEAIHLQILFKCLGFLLRIIISNVLSRKGEGLLDVFTNFNLQTAKEVVYVPDNEEFEENVDFRGDVHHADVYSGKQYNGYRHGGRT